MHPAKYSPEVIEAMVRRLGKRRGLLLDPFAGTGLSLYRFMAPGRRVVGVEIEPVWVEENRTMTVGTPAEGLLVQGDSTNLSWLRNGSVRMIATSVAYGNRFADHHKANEVCSKCKGAGCAKCEHTGKRNHTRRGYTHDARATSGDPDYELAVTNTGLYHAHNPEYWDLHQAVYEELTRKAARGAQFILNASDFLRNNGERVPVVLAHLDMLVGLGWHWTYGEVVNTQRMGMGANREARVDGEWVHELVKA